MMIVLGILLYLVLILTLIQFGRFMKECDVSLMSSEGSGFHRRMTKPLSHRRMVHRRIR